MNKVLKLLLLAITVTSVSVSAFAGAAQIKASMKARLPQVEALKNQGAIGENNLGYVTVLKNTGKAAALVTAENKDRKVIYTALAKKLKTTPVLVGKRRAKQISGRAPKGQMIQNAKGKWIKK